MFDKEECMKRNAEYITALIKKAGWAEGFNIHERQEIIDSRIETCQPIMLSYQNKGNEWWLEKNAKMAFFQMHEFRILLVNLNDLLDELSKLLDRKIDMFEVTCAKPEQRKKLVKEVDNAYSMKFGSVKDEERVF